MSTRKNLANNKERRQKRAAERAAKRAELTAEQQIASLDKLGLRALRERTRLKAKLEKLKKEIKQTKEQA